MMRFRLIALILSLSALCAACGGSSPVSPSPFRATPAGLERDVEDGGGGGFQCFFPNPCPETGHLRFDAGDADFFAFTGIRQSATDPFSFVTTANLILLAGHFSGGTVTIDVANRTMLLSASLIGPNDTTLEITGEGEAVQSETRNLSCVSDRELTTTSTFILRYLGRTVITETHCILP